VPGAPVPTKSFEHQSVVSIIEDLDVRAEVSALVHDVLNALGFLDESVHFFGAEESHVCIVHCVKILKASDRHCKFYSSSSNRFHSRQLGRTSLIDRAIAPTAIKAFARHEHVRSNSELDVRFMIEYLALEGTTGFEEASYHRPRKEEQEADDEDVFEVLVVHCPHIILRLNRHCN
jgi:hypothetical protein